jgi:hypothetical protein
MVRIPNFMFPMLLSSTMATPALAQGEPAFGPVTHLRVPVESVQGTSQKSLRLLRIRYKIAYRLLRP